MNQSRIITVHAFVLKRKNIGESDKVLTIFTKTQGKMRVIAKGVRKITSRRGPYLDIFNELKLSLHDGKGIYTVSEVDMIASRRATLTTWMRMRAAYLVVELVDHLLPENEQQTRVYEAIGEVLTAIGTSPDNQMTALLLGFCNGLLVELGYLSSAKPYSSFSEVIGYIERITERKMRSLKFFVA